MPLLSPAALLLDEVARSGSIRRAAERLNSSASAVNRHILLLEAEIGVPLFERLARGVRLTAAGEVVVTEVRRWRREQDQARVKIQELQGLRRGHINIGTMECFASELIPHVITRLQARLPRITVDAMVGGTSHLLERLVERSIDLMLCFNAPPREDLRTILKFSGPTGVIVNPSHPLAGQGSIRLADCAAYTFVLPDQTLAIRNVIEQAFARAAVDPIGLVTTNSTAMIKSLVRDSEMVTVLSYFDVYREVKDGQLAYLNVLGDRLPSEELSLCVNRGVRQSGPSDVMVQIINEELDLLVSGIPKSP